MARNRPFLLTMLLVSIGLRTLFGAPCCLDPVAAAETATHHGHHAHASALTSPGADSAEQSSDSDADEQEANPAANPCCSACGPTLPADPIQLAVRTAPRILPEPAPVRELATRPPFPAYDATGPPELI